MKYAPFGSISCATLRTEDLLPAFADALENCLDDNPEHDDAKLRILIQEARDADPESEEVQWTLEELMDAL